MKRFPLFLLSVLVLPSCEKFEDLQEKNLDTGKQQTLYQVPYGPKGRHVLDIALPKNRNTNTPVVIFIHGGAWVSGDKVVFAREIQQFSDAGIACATINYRYASDITNIHHPDLPNDVNLAIDCIASKSELWQISPNRFGIVGHSAGGHLALSTAYARTDGKVKACASWAGLTNLIDDDQLRISGAPALFKTYVGVELNDAADTLLYKNASPYWNATQYSVPTLLIYGTKDPGVPYSNAVRLKDRLDTLHVSHSLVTLHGAGHIWGGKNLDKARTTTLSWFLSRL